MVVVLVLGLAGCSAPVARGPFRGGVCLAGRADPAGFGYLKAHGVSWLAAVPFGYGQQAPDRPPAGGFRRSRYPGESLEDTREIVQAAKQAGLRVLVKPHLWFFRHGAWRGDIHMTSEADWARFFAAYRRFLAPFLDLAKELGADAFCLGTELGGTTGRERDWRALIAWARTRFAGELTYAAHWDRFDAVGFWDALDFIGVQAYFPLARVGEPSEDDLVRAWAPWKRRLVRLASRYRKPVVFTELGYPARKDAAARPWQATPRAAADSAAQARAYRAAFRALDGAAWLAGVFIWKWPAGYAGGSPPARGFHDGGFSPQGYPAEALIFRWFGERTARR